MSDNSNSSGHGGAHTSHSKRLLLTVVFSFLIPVLIVIGLISTVTSSDKPPASVVDPERAVAARIQKVGLVQIGSANHALRSGEDVYKAVCSACHQAGALGSPKFGDAAAWGPRIKTGFDALLNSAMKGKNAMPAQGGGDQADLEIARAVVYMANAGGAKFAEPKAPAAGATEPKK